jgi:putative transposase
MKRSRFTEEQIIGILKGTRGQRFGRRSLPQAWCQRRQHLQMEGQVRRDGCLGGQAAEHAGGREHAAEAAAGGCHAGQRGAEGPLRKEVVTPAGKRKAVAHLVNT